MENENINIESAETQDVAEPETEEALESEEMQEVAEPDEAENSEEEQTEEHTGRTESDAAFAEMRRNNQQLQKDNELLMAALGRYFEGETAEELSINANAYAEERDPDEYREEWERNQEFESTRAENEALKDQLLEMEIERRMEQGLREVQAIDPSVKSLDELGDSFAGFIRAGLDATHAYFATKSLENANKVYAPDAIGRVSDNNVERDYFTSEELDALTDEELDNDEIWEKAMRSMEREQRRKHND